MAYIPAETPEKDQGEREREWGARCARAKLPLALFRRDAGRRKRVQSCGPAPHPPPHQTGAVDSPSTCGKGKTPRPLGGMGPASADSIAGGYHFRAVGALTHFRPYPAADTHLFFSARPPPLQPHKHNTGPAPATPGAVAAAPADGATTSTPAQAPSSESEAAARLFKGLTFHLAREVPREPLLLVIRAFGGGVAWDGPGSPLAADSPSITHAVVDRPAGPGGPLPGRTYIQPQWVFDSANFRVRADERKYAPGLTPPPHLSPFAEAGADGGYVPAYAAELAALREAAAAAGGGGGAADQAAHVASFEADAAAVGKAAGAGGAAAVAAAPAPLVDPAAAAERAHADGLAKELGLEGGGAPGGPPGPPAAPAAAANTDDADAVALRKSLLPRKKRNLYESVAKNQAAKTARGVALAARKAELDGKK